MSILNDSIKKLELNSDDVYNETVRLLVKIIDNVLKEPTNKKLRVLQKNNATIAKKILAVNGGLDCLKAIGFIEVVVHVFFFTNQFFCVLFTEWRYFFITGHSTKNAFNVRKGRFR